MDWYFSRECDDLIVPNEQEKSEVLCKDNRSLSPNDWLQWGITTPERFKLSNKRHISTAMELTAEEFNFGKLGASRHGHGFLDSQPDYQLQNLCQSIKGSGGINWMDEIFLNSLLEEESSDLENPYRPVGIFIESECSSMPVESVLTDDWDTKEDGPQFHFSPSDSGRTEGSPTVKPPMFTVFIPAELNSSCKADEHSEDDSLEAAVLQELKDIMSQLNQKTWISFRDGLYRLAKSSKRKHSTDQSKTEFSVEDPSIASVQNERSRCSSMKLESETNVIDRTVMNLLFHKLNCGSQLFLV